MDGFYSPWILFIDTDSQEVGELQRHSSMSGAYKDNSFVS
jgi:hypothetical protein